MPLAAPRSGDGARAAALHGGRIPDATDPYGTRRVVSRTRRATRRVAPPRSTLRSAPGSTLHADDTQTPIWQTHTTLQRATPTRDGATQHRMHEHHNTAVASRQGTRAGRHGESRVDAVSAVTLRASILFRGATLFATPRPSATALPPAGPTPEHQPRCRSPQRRSLPPQSKPGGTHRASSAAKPAAPLHPPALPRVESCRSLRTLGRQPTPSRGRPRGASHPAGPKRARGH